VRQEQVYEVAVELRTAITPGHCAGAVETTATAEYLDRSGDVDESRGQADLVAT
jgi:hypothetical protein